MGAGSMGIGFPAGVEINLISAPHDRHFAIPFFVSFITLPLFHMLQVSAHATGKGCHPDRRHFGFGIALESIPLAPKLQSRTSLNPTFFPVGSHATFRIDKLQLQTAFSDGLSWIRITFRWKFSGG